MKRLHQRKIRYKKDNHFKLIKSYYTWNEIVKLLNLPLDYFDPYVHFISENGKTCRKVVINSFGEYFECTVNQYAIILPHETCIFCPLGDFKPTQKEWRKIKFMSSEKIEKYLGRKYAD
jgi:hypothetical protein